jgi:phage/conjugal plasmid C-4 type zinc finger TraR family protein
VTDQFDRAQALELAEYERNQQKAIMPKAARPSAKWCIAPGCGERIPDARRKAIPGVERCIGCQNLNEKNKGKYANSN